MLPTFENCFIVTQCLKRVQVCSLITGGWRASWSLLRKCSDVDGKKWKKEVECNDDSAGAGRIGNVWERPPRRRSWARMLTGWRCTRVLSSSKGFLDLGGDDRRCSLRVHPMSLRGENSHPRMYTSRPPRWSSTGIPRPHPPVELNASEF